METKVSTPQMVFMQPQRLIVPLFQRPYVWNEESQWAPLWDDVTRLAGRLLAEPDGKHYPHFLGAVVLQQVQNQTGSMQERTVIDGQQRLTTLQILLDALHAELDSVGATQQAKRVHALVVNDEAFWDHPEDQFKVWPTNRDRPAFNEVMGAPVPVAYSDLANRGARLVEAHRFFADQARLWLHAEGQENVGARAGAIERTLRELLQIVVIDLTADENAQEIFETLNARGAQLTAADLIKNFIFQRLMEAGVNVEAAYEKSWKEFETAFWEKEVTVGSTRYSRSSIFLNHWLIARTGKEIVAREVFSRFKRFADDEAGMGMEVLLAQLDRSARVYRKYMEAAGNLTGPIDRLGLFAYRTGTLDSEVFKPLVLLLHDPELAPVPDDQIRKALESVESWLVRRMLVRANSKSYGKIAVELVNRVRVADRAMAGDTVEQYLRDNSSAGGYWPDDNEVRQELSTIPLYARINRGRLRMVLEAIEDHKRGWIGGSEGLGGQRVLRGKYTIEHVMPQNRTAHWPISPSGISEADRDKLIHTLGNLTLLTKKMNSKASNKDWDHKSAELKKHDVLKLNMDLLLAADGRWDDELIRSRTVTLTDAVVSVWPVPAGHKSEFGSQPDVPRRKIELIDLIGAGFLEAGATLYPRGKKLIGRNATVLMDGRIDVDGIAFVTPSAAAISISGRNENGWSFFRTSPDSKQTLSDLWHQYVDQTSAEVDEDDMPDEDDDE